MQRTQTTLDKALSVNIDPMIYGTFAEIGAGQEVARCFFLAGKASQTIAKTMSAYDMIFSDEIYGKEKSGRYVCESRLDKMLDKEFQLLHRRLDSVRGASTKFFAFADTVATGDQKKKYSHGWLGIRFQAHPQGEANDIVMHVRILDKYRLQQQEVLGVLGTNLVYAAFNDTQDHKKLIGSLMENLKAGQVAIDFVRIAGPDLAHLHNSLIGLELVRRGLTESILFSPDEKIVDISDTLFNKPLLVQRGLFRPVTKTHIEVLGYGEKHFKKTFQIEPMTLFELSMYQAEASDKIDEKEFLGRVNSLCMLGHYVLVSKFFLYYKLKRFLRSYTSAPIALIVGAYHLGGLFDEQHYADLDGGLLEGLGKLFGFNHQNFCLSEQNRDLLYDLQNF